MRISPSPSTLTEFLDTLVLNGAANGFDTAALEHPDRHAFTAIILAPELIGATHSLSPSTVIESCRRQFAKPVTARGYRMEWNDYICGLHVVRVH